MNISANVSSLQANQTFANVTANNVANVNTDRFVPQNTIISDETNESVKATVRDGDDNGSQKSQTDLAKEIPVQITSVGVAQANAAAIRTQDDMLGTVLDIKA